MPQRQDFAVQRVHGRDDLLHLIEHFRARCRLAGRGHVAYQQRRQRGRGGQGISAATQINLTVGVPHLRAEVMAVDVGQRLQDDHPQPNKRR
jgi:hypothetical protein